MRKSFVLSLLVTMSMTQMSLAQSNFELLFGDKEKYRDVLIKEVLSVETFMIEMDNKPERIRLIGLRGPGDAPQERAEQEEVGEFAFVMDRGEDAENPIEPLQAKAFDFVRNLLEGKRVRLEFDVNRTGDDHKTLAYAYLLEDDTFVNEAILKAGYAYLSIQPPNTKYAKELRAAYKEARQERLGLSSQ